ncbi:DUF262 domain-containing protein [Comamonas sp. NLF-1-9]|uniref:DUF262 domain-containing protein n=1 Tax=Comamonas sp. NLF-1-9 TaxID=2853163 RepID=UPI001C476F7C|nr:DUF262 domain-containing protein [Comamonas sp. NLF-1-9]QXL84495.1 DUF262 domain-containing protein [Comamonas sp. NLF-1-9]
MLSKEIEVSQRLVRTDAYQMSVGEIVNMYKDREIVIDPDFQRLFRWEASQKSKLIESILLGIPLPPIFVFERETAKWELIDGLQRLSTILEFMGLLRGPEGDILPPSYLEATKYLPSLRNTVWESSEAIPDLPIDEQAPLDKTAQLSIRRARIGVEILKRPSDNKTKFDLFQRLNSGGTPANPQELRNCVIIMVNAGYFAFLKELATSPAFRTAISLTDEQEERQKHLEYLCRFLCHVYVPYDDKLDVEEYVDEGMQTLAVEAEVVESRACFEFTFNVLNEAFGTDALRRQTNGQAGGRVGLVALECIAVGVAKNYAGVRTLPDPVTFVRQRISDLWKSNEVTTLHVSGLRGTLRISRSVPLGAKWFKP